MSKRKRKNRKEDTNVEKIVLITVLLQLISAIVNLIEKLIE